MNTQEKQPMRMTLKNAEKYKMITFPLSQALSVRATIQNLKLQYSDSGLNFETKKNKETKLLEVVRTA